MTLARKSLTTERVRPDEMLASFWRDVEAARRALARGRASAVAHTARGLLATLWNIRVRVELAHAAATFAEGLDDRPLAEEWVHFAVAARATLEHAVRTGAAELSDEIAELDDAFADAAEAVLLLEPEDYKEALAGTPPRTRAWWGARARLDGAVREIDLERALGILSERR